MSVVQDPEAARRIVNRLKRARGQLDAVISAAESGEDCQTVVTRLATVSGALDKAGFAIISQAMQECLRPETDERVRRARIEELETLFLRLS
ncbi:DNA-binding transcriptional regulator, FrmR family [Agromyces sp. CF514]|uniref:metal-sensitive transcriptional regulator n=1 Tax=Agromyces sp. CF514 TaxID=1881031 RepID=UPI0008E1EE9F|nr:metal-sensitive transcriptional regulator [Agromyces sp. CF514]SFR69300.1 DNA-binding transcriptional regulator, FrmR family [Agromyces sp. CF514]